MPFKLSSVSRKEAESLVLQVRKMREGGEKRQTDRQADRQADRQTDRQSGRQIETKASKSRIE